MQKPPECSDVGAQQKRLDSASCPQPETTGSIDSLLALGTDLPQLGDSEDASASLQHVDRPQRLLPPPLHPDVHDIVRSVSVHRRELLVRDTYGKEILTVPAAYSEVRPAQLRL